MPNRFSLASIGLSAVFGMLATIAWPVSASVLAAGEDDSQYKKELAEIEALTTKRDLELYELEFAPLVMDRLVITDKIDGVQVVNFLVFRIRNQATDSTKALHLKAKGYNEVLQAVTTQYEIAKIQSEGGVRLVVDGVADAKDAVILERQESKPRTRTVNLSAIAFDERGTRMRLLDEIPGKGPQEAFAFPDLGNTRRAFGSTGIREKIESLVGRRLYTPEQIRTMPLPPFDGVTRVDAADPQAADADRHGWFVGELYGVFIFERLDDHGQSLAVEVSGVSNKYRIRTPPIEPGKVANYAEMRVARRTYVMEYDWKGDEFYRQDDSFVLRHAGWAWVDSFQRQERRADMAYAKFFLDNIQDDKGERRPGVEDEFWAYYNRVRSSRAGSKHADGLPDLQKLTK